MGLEVFRSGEWSWPTVVALSWALLAAPFLLVWIFFLRRENPRKLKYRLPPGPPTWPILGHLKILADKTRPTHHIVDDLSKVYGPLLLLKVGVMNMVFVSDPELAMEVTKAQDHLFSYRPPLLVGKYLLYGESHITMEILLNFVFTRNVSSAALLEALSQPGEYHGFVRKFLVSELLSNKKLRGFKGIRMEEQTSIIREAYLASQRKESIDVRDLFSTLTLNVITRMAFGKKFRGLDVKVDEGSNPEQTWIHIIPEVLAKFGQMLAESLHPSLYWVDTVTGVRKGMQSCQRRLDVVCQELVDEHKQRLDALTPKELEEYEPNDFMDTLLLQRSKENGQYITDKNLKGVSVDLIIGGSNTSATTMEWIMTELIAQPDLMKRTQEEVDSVVGFDRVVDESDISNLPFLNAVVKETLRLHPPLPWLLPHFNRVDCKVGGYDIPKGSMINVNVYGMSRSASSWEDPLRFNPDRFLKTDCHFEMKGAHPELLPFGTGRRICPGMYMASAMVNSTVARMLHSFNWSTETKNGVPQIDRTERPGYARTAKLVTLKVSPASRLPAHLYR